jgi:hypothetical protein
MARAGGVEYTVEVSNSDHPRTARLVRTIPRGMNSWLYGPAAAAVRARRMDQRRGWQPRNRSISAELPALWAKLGAPACPTEGSGSILRSLPPYRIICNAVVPRVPRDRGTTGGYPARIRSRSSLRAAPGPPEVDRCDEIPGLPRAARRGRERRASTHDLSAYAAGVLVLTGPHLAEAAERVEKDLGPLAVTRFDGAVEHARLRSPSGPPDARRGRS